jgi:hypothetical protein
MTDVNENANVNESAEETNETTEAKDTKKDTNKDTKALEKKYTDEDVNNISKKNSDKAVSKFMKDLGIDDVEEAKTILAHAKEEREKNKSVDEKTQELINKAQKQTLVAMDMTIENALLRKKVDDSKVARAKRLVDKEAILNEKGEIDENKLNEEIEAVIKDFPELVPSADNMTAGFKIGGDGKEDKAEDPLDKVREIMGLKKK